jgi:hypothetical protein
MSTTEAVMAAAIALGLPIAVWGLAGRRIARTGIVCELCGRNMDRLPAGRCPECGGRPWGWWRGQRNRRRRWRGVCAGALLLSLVWLAPAYRDAGRVPVWRRSTWRMIVDLAVHARIVQDGSVSELERRWRLDRLRPIEREALMRLARRDWRPGRTGTQMRSAFFIDRARDAGRLDPAEVDGVVRAAIEDIGDDDTPGNALQALFVLQGFYPAGATHLHRALHDPDRQRRQVAALVLAYNEDERGPRLLEVMVEGLADDRLGEVRSYFGWNASRFVSELLVHVDAAEPHLLAALDSPDLQQRSLAAHILACAGREEVFAPAARVLIANLADNDRRADAHVARFGLETMGRPIIPVLAEARKTGDAQSRAFIDDLVYAFEDIDADPYFTPSHRRMSRIVHRWPWD